MSRLLRLALVFLGLAVAVYGIAALTGCWLGEPPWWPQLPEGRTVWNAAPPSVVLEGREWIGLGVTILGLSLALAASPPRLLGFFLGSALAVYAVASLTGAWLGEPPWWRTKTHELEAITADDARILRRTGVAFRADGAYYPRPGREWISGGVLVVGLGLAIVSRALRMTLVVLGLALAIYGIASLTGGWLGTPPWWEHEALGSDSGLDPVAFPRRGREWVSERLVLVGLGVAVLGAWPWRRRPPTSV